MEEEASTASMEEEEERFNRWQWQPVDQWQWQPGSVVAGGAPDLLLSEEDLSLKTKKNWQHNYVVAL
jgi:hypothetical protein